LSDRFDRQRSFEFAQDGGLHRVDPRESEMCESQTSQKGIEFMWL
jgi:hypothetical protein